MARFSDNCQCTCSDPVATPPQCLTGCDTKSVYYRHGKENTSFQMTTQFYQNMCLSSTYPNNTIGRRHSLWEVPIEFIWSFRFCFTGCISLLCIYACCIPLVCVYYQRHVLPQSSISSEHTYMFYIGWEIISVHQTGANWLWISLGHTWVLQPSYGEAMLHIHWEVYSNILVPYPLTHCGCRRAGVFWSPMCANYMAVICTCTNVMDY